MSLFVIIFILSSFVFVKFLLNRMNTYIEVNGEISMGICCRTDSTDL